MDILNQVKLTRSEWDSIEIPVPSSEKEILKMIHQGYNNINLIVNNNLNMIQYTKLSPSSEIHSYLFQKYFKPIIYDSFEKVKKNDPLLESFSDDDKTLKKMKSADLIRIQNVDKSISVNIKDIYEYDVMDLCRIIFKKMYKKQSYLLELYTLIQWEKAKIEHSNPQVLKLMSIVINYGVNNSSIESVVQESFHLIEKNAKLYKYDNLYLHSHQKELFSLCKTTKNPKLILYTAPTGTGKTLSPIGLCNGYKIIFVCVARHVGLALAKSAISIEKKVAFAFGCETVSDIRLHYFAAVDYEVNRKSGGIWRVDNSNGSMVEIMICDVHSYLHAMNYMCAFNEASNIITYWDEPTMTLDYETHELHAKIKDIWNNNRIPNIVLSCATLPKEEELMYCLQDFRTHFENAEINTITSYDCKKSIPILNSKGFSFVPHLYCNTITQLHEYASFCKGNKTLLRYFDLEEIISFILFIHNHCNGLDNHLHMDAYFESVKEVNMNNLKLYYLNILESIDEMQWKYAKYHLLLNQKKKYHINGQNGNPLERTQSVQHTANDRDNQTIVRNQSDTTINETPTSQMEAALEGVFLTTKDAYTLTDGPTIYLADNIMNLAKFYVKQSKIPDMLLQQLLHRIQRNDDLFKSIQTMEQELELKIRVKDNVKTDDQKEKKPIQEKEGLEENTQVLKDNIQNLRSQLFHITLHPAYIPNKNTHQEKWTPDKKLHPNAFTSDLGENHVKQIMKMDISTSYKVLILMGIGVLIKQEIKEYEEMVKTLAEEQKLFLILTSSDYIYGTNYQFCHGFIGKDLQYMTPQKTLQAMGRIGRNKHQQDYSVRFRDDNMIHNLFRTQDNLEAVNMNQLFCRD